MSDDRQSDHSDDSELTLGEPGGGPKRVVSERSVDDILESVTEPEDETTAGETGDDETVSTAATAETDTESNDDLEETAAAGDYPISTPDESNAVESEPDVDVQSEPVAGPDKPTESAPDSRPTDENQPLDLDAANQQPAQTSEPTLEEAVSILENAKTETTLEEAIEVASDTAKPDSNLAKRIESGTVTGADVRAAEAGPGREPTPDIDEIDLSLDDLETVDAPTDPSGATNDAETDDDKSSGMLGRLKQLFSG